MAGEKLIEQVSHAYRRARGAESRCRGLSLLKFLCERRSVGLFDLVSCCCARVEEGSVSLALFVRGFLEAGCTNSPRRRSSSPTFVVVVAVAVAVRRCVRAHVEAEERRIASEAAVQKL